MCKELPWIHYPFFELLLSKRHIDESGPITTHPIVFVMVIGNFKVNFLCRLVDMIKIVWLLTFKLATFMDII